ncbi:nucleotidyltransferase domain-containing protein [Paenibacillus chitinolyticus]|uniref:nucleotidyltransferase domain-containing protein n=1 Tax=Paenibacillus chitinolyticus TaxID=79263 RepID=UPI0036337720
MIDPMFENQTESQLKVLSEISTICATIKCKFWLRGGWAIDFLLGKVTRPHDDIDLITWIQNREQLECALAEAGYEQTPVKEQFRGRQSDFRKGDVDITFGYITSTHDGSIIMNDLPEWVWRHDSLLPQSLLLNGISAHVLSPRQLLEEKEVYKQIGRKPRSKDEDSKNILHRIIAELN